MTHQAGAHDAPEILRTCLATGSANAVARLADALAADATGRGPLWPLILDANLTPFAGFLLVQHALCNRLTTLQAAHLQQASDNNALRQALLIREAVELTRRLGAAGVRVAWLKGLWISTCVLDRPGMRYMEDIDLLVPSAQYEAALTIVEDAGFTVEVPASDSHPSALSFWRPGDLPGSDGALRLDLHRAVLASAQRELDEQGIWDATECRRIKGVDVVVPTMEAGLVMAAIHAFKHAYDVRHLWAGIADLSAILRRRGDALDVDWLVARMADATVAVAIYILLCASGPDGAAGTVAARRLAAAAQDRVRDAGVIGAADGILRRARRLRAVRKGDFSLMAVGEERAPVAVRQVATMIGRRLGRMKNAAAGVHRTGPLTAAVSAASHMTANWRYAYTSFLVGRLKAKLETQTAIDRIEGT